MVIPSRTANAAVERAIGDLALVPAPAPAAATAAPGRR
jgi:hypothetical protein